MSRIPTEDQESLLHAILNADLDGATALINKLVQQSGWRNAYTSLVEPVLCKAGSRWDEGRHGLNLAQGYVAAKAVELTLLNEVERIDSLQIKDANQSPKPGPIILGNTEDDMHELGKRMVSAFLKGDGWDIIDLGPDVLADEFVDVAIQAGAGVIGVSAMTYTNAMNIRSVREEIDLRGLNGQIRLAVGGAVFSLRPELAKEVGADGTASNAFNAPSLFDELYSIASLV